MSFFRCLLSALLGAALGCDMPQLPAPNGDTGEYLSRDVRVLRDEKRGVTCYYDGVGHSGAISCVPDRSVATCR